MTSSYLYLAAIPCRGLPVYFFWISCIYRVLFLLNKPQLTMPKQKTYTADYKLSSIEYAKVHGNQKAGCIFSIDEKLIHEWHKDKLLWRKLILGSVHDVVVSTISIKNKARELAAEMKIPDFSGGVNWVYKFMNRSDLHIWPRTTVGQKLPDDWEEKMVEFIDFVNEECMKSNLQPGDIIIMDEVPMSFDIQNTRTVAEHGSKTISATTTGHERSRFTVVFSICCKWQEA